MIFIKLLFLFTGLTNNDGELQKKEAPFDVQGTAIYNYQMAEDNFTLEGNLFFNSTKHMYTYKQVPEGQLVLEEDFKRQVIISDSKGFVFYHDAGGSKERYFCSDQAYIVNDTYTLDWSISKDKKQVAGYDCLKAQTKFRGRKYTAWFTTAIPVGAGPWKFYGLPGLILEAYDKDREVNFSIKSLNLKTSSTSNIEFTFNDPNISHKELLECRTEVWNEKTERLLSRAAMMQANSDVEIEIEVPDEPPFTEKE